MPKKTTQTKTTNYTEFSGISESDLEASSLLGIPEVQSVIGFYKHEISRINADKSGTAFTKKLKLNKLKHEYFVFARKLKHITIGLQALEKDDTNEQAKADLPVMGLELASICQFLMQKNNITSSRQPEATQTNTDPN